MMNRTKWRGKKWTIFYSGKLLQHEHVNNMFLLLLSIFFHQPQPSSSLSEFEGFDQHKHRRTHTKSIATWWLWWWWWWSFFLFVAGWLLTITTTQPFIHSFINQWAKPENKMNNLAIKKKLNHIPFCFFLMNDDYDDDYIHSLSNK